MATLVDRLIDHGLQLSPATDWSLIIPENWLALLPLDGDRLTRSIDHTRAGYYTTPVYRGFEVVPQPITKPLLILADASGLIHTQYLNTETGAIGSDLDDIGLIH